ncbi:Uncharacterised protein [Yersinia thracica]|uniref:Uncharacterized protein n=1 Tax=Yersinia thracica TaxID=2890319 RepID=A0A0T9PNC9_9GAMM|nr:Uncharacterised protein [Yersinia thracica]
MPAFLLITNLSCRTETDGATAPMGTPVAYATTTYSAHFPAYQLFVSSLKTRPYVG